MFLNFNEKDFARRFLKSKIETQEKGLKCAQG